MAVNNVTLFSIQAHITICVAFLFTFTIAPAISISQHDAHEYDVRITTRAMLQRLSQTTPCVCLSPSGVRTVERLAEVDEWRAVVESLMRPNCANETNTPRPHDWDFTEAPKDHQDVCATYEYGGDEFWK